MTQSMLQKRHFVGLTLKWPKIDALPLMVPGSNRPSFSDLGLGERQHLQEWLATRRALSVKSC